jgi:hypothetical protein
MAGLRDFFARAKATEGPARVWTVIGGMAALAALPLAIVVAVWSADSPPSPAAADVENRTSSTTFTPQPLGSPAATPPIETSSVSPTQSASPEATTEFRVSLGELCNASDAEIYICGTEYEDTIQVGDQVFTHVGSGNVFATVKPPSWGLILKFPANTCTKLVIQFAVNSRGSGTARTRIIQTGSQPQVASTSYSAVGTLRADLNGTPFILQYNSTTGRAVFANGYAMCRTSSGQ